jgi:hypothetical protein
MAVPLAAYNPNQCRPLSPLGRQRFDGGLEEIGVGTPAATASASSRLRTVNGGSRTVWGKNGSKNVIQTPDVKSP